MKKYQGIPELLEAYMEENAADERWITAHELRDRFGLTRYQSNTVSAFLRRLEVGPFRQYPFIVAKIATGRGRKTVRSQKMPVSSETKEMQYRTTKANTVAGYDNQRSRCVSSAGKMENPA